MHPWCIQFLYQFFFHFLLVQHIELTMVGAQYSFKIARLETKDGCPLGPGSNLNRTFNMKPLAQSCGQERGLAVDASLSKERDETNLARYIVDLKSEKKCNRENVYIKG